MWRVPSLLHSPIFSSSTLTASVERGLCMYFRTLCLCLIASSIVMISMMNCVCKDKQKTVNNGKNQEKTHQIIFFYIKNIILPNFTGTEGSQLCNLGYFCQYLLPNFVYWKAWNLATK